MSTESEGLLGITKVAKYLDVSKSSVNRYISNGLIPKVTIGGRTLIKIKDLEDFIEKNRATSKAI
tara:strand:+ start:629 stop:823 length:195 start_codon:yes stop_codon:yes gene_type:complete